MHKQDSLSAGKAVAPTSGLVLDDRYTATTGRVFLTGNQALVPLPIQRRLLDTVKGLNTGGFISGYRGSPLGRYDMELWSAAKAEAECESLLMRANHSRAA